MKQLKSIPLLSLLLGVGVMATGCDQSVTNFVKQSRPSNITNPLSPVVSNGPSQMKMSPGKMASSAANASVIATVTATNHFASAANASAAVAISRSRTSVVQ